MKIALSLVLFMLAQFALYDVYCGALTADPFLQGWIAVLLHGFALAAMLAAGYLFGAMRAAPRRSHRS